MTIGAIKIKSSSKLETIKKFWKRAENKQKLRKNKNHSSKS